MKCVSSRGKWYQVAVMIAAGFFLAAGIAAAEESNKLFINKEDLNRLNIKGSSGSYNYDEREGTDLLSHYTDHYNFKGETQIKPGWFARCGSDFTLTNAGPGSANFQVVLDGTHVHYETLGQNDSKDYIVKRDPVKRVGVMSNLSDVGVVLNHSDSAVLKMSCQ